MKDLHSHHDAVTSQAAPPLLPQTDLVGYNSLIEFLAQYRIGQIDGDFLEIGCFLGGGTAKLAQLATALGKRVWVIDIFDPDFDETKNAGGQSMAGYYRTHLRGASQEEIFKAVTKPWTKSIHVIKEDSRKVRFPPQTRFSFAFADGNHDPAWVENDFRLLWSHLNPGGWAGFHDYAGDLPQVTATLDRMLREYAGDIDRVETIPDQWLLLVHKRSAARRADPV
jgi:SAM-dependent methyltransferase